MRAYAISLILCLVALGSGTFYFRAEHSRLKRFCDDVPLGASIVQVRKSAQKLGFEPQIETFSQLRVLPRYWHMAPPSCRVFFNRDQAVQFRITETS